MKYEPKQTERNRRFCVICKSEFYAFPSSNRKACKSTECALAILSHRGRRHGESNTRLHNIWNGMKNRCLHKTEYKHLDVCDAWQSYETFRDWAHASGYSEALEIDRRDNSKGYSPENCRWATRRQQMQNTGLRKQKNKTSKYKGVQRLSHTRKPWRALGTINAKPIQLGLFATETEAAKAYDAWAVTAYGEFASPNFKEE